MSEKNKLGRGLSSLLGDRKLSILKDEEKNNIESIKILDIDLNLIDRNPEQPRKKFDEEKIVELSESIKKYGLLEPIILKKKNNGRYEIIAGERRFIATKKAELKTIQAIIRNENDEKNNFIVSIVENIQRENLNSLEEARAYKVLNELYNYTMEDVGKVVGKSRSHINNMIRLLTLPENVQEFLLEGKIEMGHARALINYKYASEIISYIVDNNLSVRDVEKLIQDEKNKQDDVVDISKNNISVQKNVKNKIKDDNFKKFEEKLSYNCKIMYKKKNKKYHLAIEFDNYGDLENFINKNKK